MTEIPDHLRRRAAEAKVRAAAKRAGTGDPVLARSSTRTPFGIQGSGGNFLTAPDPLADLEEFRQNFRRRHRRNATIMIVVLTLFAVGIALIVFTKDTSSDYDGEWINTPRGEVFCSYEGDCDWENPRIR